MRLQKLLYYCQAFSLVYDGTPLFKDRIEAWMNGPVVPGLWAKHRYEYMIDDVDHDSKESLDNDNIATINLVLDAYGEMTGGQLSALTHSESPWLDARRGLNAGQRSSQEITHESMQRFYSEQVRATH